jgi:hypothetical protein
MRLLSVLLTLAACGGNPVQPVATPPAPVDLVPMSDPAEYDIDRISRDAGRAIFERTGIGDPYRTGVPYPMFLALLRAYPQTFGATTTGLADRFGFVARAPDPKSTDADVRAGLPVGMHLTIDPMTNVPFVVTSCALCHAEKLRWNGAKGEESSLVVGLGNKRVKIHAYDRAFAEITKLPGFTAQKLGRLADEAARAHQIAWPERYRDAFVGATLANLTKRAAARAELHARTVADPPGRVAVIESFAFALGELAKRPIAFAPDVGWAKVPDVIGYAQRTTLSWDASQEGPIDLLVVEADIAAGVRIAWLEKHPFQGASLGAYLRQPDPRPRFPGTIDRAKAERGKARFEQVCADCHGHYASDGRIVDFDERAIPITDLGTDPTRMLAATEDFERAANDPAITRGYTRFRRGTGYVPPVLTNVWARAPYGHAGQWPSLAFLAIPPAQRPTKFHVDLDGLYDLDTVGVAMRETPRSLHHDALQKGFAVGGHPFLSDMDPSDRVAVIEYLKTL